MGIEISYKCEECNEQYHEHEFECYECKEKNNNELLKNAYDILIDEIEERKCYTINGEYGYVGFKSEDEKETFLRGFKCGIEGAMLEIALIYSESGLGDDLWKKIEKIKKKWNSQKINKKQFLTLLPQFRI